MIIDFKKCVEIIREKMAKDSPSARVILANIYCKEGDNYGFTDDEYIALCYCKRVCNYVQLDTIQGCLIGGAIGDALGLPVEFYEDYEIFKKYGENGLTELQLYNGVAHISDDTQMTLFTADGLLTATKRFKNPNADDYVQCVYEAYLDWLYTQDPTFALDENRPHSELLKVPELHHKRAPGMTCLTALYSGKCGTFTQKLNNSKGCGGIMRVAPVALYLAQFKEFSVEDVALLSARTAAITHSHELGYIPAAYLAAFLCFILKGEMFGKAAHLSNRIIKKLFPNLTETDICLNLVKKAIDLACPEDEDEELDDLEAIRALGQGWVAEETLAISMYCSFKYSDDFEKAIIAATNHSGDSDSTAAVTGNILGAYWGLRRLPQKMVAPIELKDVILDISEKMHVNKLSKEI